MEKEVALVDIQKEINKQISDPKAFQVLVETTFNGLDGQKAKRAMMEGMMRGFTFQDFLKKDVYAIPFKGGYSLITSIDYSRKLGMKGGIVGTDEPIYEMSEDGNTIISCSMTVHKQFESGYVGDFVAKVYFKEYTTGANLWKSKPMTMIAKVAEMHALRKACPAELSNAYVEEEMEQEHKKVATALPVGEWEEKLRGAKNLTEFKKVCATIPAGVRNELGDLIETLKLDYEDNNISGQGAVESGKAGESVGDKA